MRRSYRSWIAGKHQVHTVITVAFQIDFKLLDTGAKALHAVNPHTHQRQVLVTALPIGASGPMDFPGGLAVSPAGTVCIAGDLDGSLLALRQS